MKSSENNPSVNSEDSNKVNDIVSVKKNLTLINLAETPSSEVSGKHFRSEVYFSSSVWEMVKKAVNNKRYLNDCNGVVHDILFMGYLALARSEKVNYSLFNVTITGVEKRKNFVLCIGMQTNENEELTILVTKPEEYDFKKEEWIPRLPVPKGFDTSLEPVVRNNIVAGLSEDQRVIFSLIPRFYLINFLRISVTKLDKPERFVFTLMNVKTEAVELSIEYNYGKDLFDAIIVYPSTQEERNELYIDQINDLLREVTGYKLP